MYVWSVILHLSRYLYIYREAKFSIPISVSDLITYSPAIKSVEYRNNWIVLSPCETTVFGFGALIIILSTAKSFWLIDIQSTERFLKVRNRRLRVFEYKYCAALLQRAEVRKWLTNETLGLLWMEDYSESRFTDWMTALALDVVDQASRSNHNTVLRYICQVVF